MRAGPIADSRRSPPATTRSRSATPRRRPRWETSRPRPTMTACGAMRTGEPNTSSCTHTPPPRRGRGPTRCARSLGHAPAPQRHGRPFARSRRRRSRPWHRHPSSAPASRRYRPPHRGAGLQARPTHTPGGPDRPARSTWEPRHFTTTTVVPRPDSVSTESSSTRRRLPDSPRPSSAATSSTRARWLRRPSRCFPLTRPRHGRSRSRQA